MLIYQQQIFGVINNNITLKLIRILHEQVKKYGKDINIFFVLKLRAKNYLELLSYTSPHH
jgi:hypothetical protein